MKEDEIINQNQDEAAASDHDCDRRAMLKSSACVIGACYLAPTTLNLLMATRATAQSSDPCANQPGPLYTVTIDASDWGTGEVMARYTYVDGNCPPIEFDVTARPTLVEPEGFLYIYTVDRDFDMSINGGPCTNGSSSRVNSDRHITVTRC